MRPEAVRKVTEQLRSMWANMPKVQVLGFASELPTHVKRKAGARLGAVEGHYDPVSGKVFLVSNNLATAQHAAKVALHEIAGHHGLRNVISAEQFNPVMKEAFRALEGQVLEADGTLRRAESGERESTLLRVVSRGRDIDLSTDEGKAAAAEEAMARLAETAPQTTVLADVWNKIYRMVRRAIRPVANAAGFDEMTMSDGEIRSILANARGSLGTKGTTFTIGSDTTAEHPWHEMGFKMSGPTYYSRMADVILNPDDKVNQKFRNGNEVSPSTMKSLLESVQNGRFKKAELEAIGIMDWLDSLEEDVGLEDVQEFIEEHQIHIEEDVVLSKEENRLNRADRALEEARQRVADAQNEAEQAQETLDSESYEITQELISTLEEEFNTDRAESVGASLQGVVDQAVSQNDPDTDRADVTTEEPEALQERYDQLRQEKRDLTQQLENEQYSTSHFEDNNVLAHIRTNVREVNGFKTLFVEEIQSDWVQDGRDKGFRKTQMEAEEKVSELMEELDALEEERREIVDNSTFERTDEQQARLDENRRKEEDLINEVQELRDVAEGTSDSVPDLPDVLKQNWYNLTAKRVMLHAAKNGFDTVAWTTGDQQADRYHLGDQFTELRYKQGSLIGVKEYNGNEIRFNLEESPSTAGIQGDVTLEDIVGETLAQDLRQEYQRTGEEVTRSGREEIDNVDRRNGMQEFYDNKLWNVFSDFTEKYGGQAAPAESGEFAVGPNGENDVHAATVPEEMKTQLPESGVPLFSLSSSQVTSENFKEWFGDWQSNGERSSKVVDQETGEPKVVYHGTSDSFNTFRTNDLGDVLSRAIGSHFAESKEVANFFATQDEIDPNASTPFARRMKRQSNMMPVYLDIKNPLVIKENHQGTDDRTVGFEIMNAVFSERKDLFDKWADSVGLRADQRDYQNLEDTLSSYGRSPASNRLTMEIIQEFQRITGHDGIRYENNSYEETTEQGADNATAWIAFDAQQIKSATGNNGNFSDGEGNMLKSENAEEVSESTGAADNLGRDREGPGAESPLNPETIVGEIRNMLSQMKVVGSEAHDRVKDFLIERGEQSMVDPNGRIVIESFQDVRTISEMVGEYLYYEWRDAIQGDLMDASPEQISAAFDELENIARNIDRVNDEMDAEAARTLAFSKLLGDHLLRGRDTSGVAPELTELFESFAEKYDLEQNFYHVQDMFLALDDQGKLDRFDSKVAITEENGSIGKDVFKDPVGAAKEWMQEASKWAVKKQEQWYEAMYDQYYPIYVMMRDMNGGAMPDTVEENFYLHARMQHGADALAKVFLEKGVRTLDGRSLGNSMTDALAPVSETQRMYRDFARYAVARRAKELHEQKRRDEDAEGPSRPDDFEVKIPEDEADAKIEQLFADKSETFQKGTENERSGLGYNKSDFEQAFEDLQEYNSALLDYAVDEGYLNENEADAMRKMNKAYVPWQRVMDTDEAKKNVDDGSDDGLNVFEGGSKDLVIDNPLKSIVANTHSLLREIHRNRIYEGLYRNIPTSTGDNSRNNLTGSYAREVAPPEERINYTVESVVQKLTDEGVDEEQAESVRETITDENGELLSFFVPKKFMGSNGADDIVRVMVDGKERWMQVEAEFENALGNGDTNASKIAQGLNGNGVAETFRSMANAFRGLVTSENPIFGALNLFRDLPTRAIQTMSQGPAESMVGMFGALKIGGNLLRKDGGDYQELYEDFLTSGAGMATLSMVERQTAQDADSVRRAAAGGKSQGAGINDMLSAFETYAQEKKDGGNPSLMNAMKQALGRLSPRRASQNFNNALENANRVKEFKEVRSNVMKEKAAKYAEENNGAELSNDQEAMRKAKREAALKAGLRAREVVIDFSRTGSWGRIANRYVPFFNAALQGYDVVKRTIRQNPARAAKMIGLTQVVPSIFVAALNAGNKYYEEEDDFTKDRFWLLPNPAGDHDSEGTAMDFIRIPKPHIYGAFGSAVERFVNYGMKEGYISEGDLLGLLEGFGDRVRRGQESGFVQSVGAQLPFNVARPIEEGPVRGTALSAIDFFGVHPLLTVGEHAVNYSVFQGREIVPEGDKDRLEPYLTYSETSSKTAREVADAANQMGVQMSPRVVDHYIDGLFGTGGRIAVSSVSDNALNATTGADSDNIKTIKNKAAEELQSGEADPSELKMSYEGYKPDGRRETSSLSFPDLGFMIDPLTKSFVAGDQFRGSKSVSRAYRHVNRAKKKASSLEDMVKKGRPKSEIREYIDDNLLAIQLGGAGSEGGGLASDVRQELMELQNQKKKLLGAGFDEKSATEKLGMLQGIWLRQVEMTRDFNEKVNDEMDKIHEGKIDTGEIADDVVSDL